MVMLLVTANLPAQSTQAVSADELELAATNAFNAGDYEAAIDLFKKTAELVQADAERFARIHEVINVCKENLVTVDLDAAKRAVKPVLRPGDFAPAPNVPSDEQSRKPHAPPVEGEVREIGIKELGNFQYDPEKGGGVPEDVQALSGSSVRVQGFMIPLTAAEKIEEFVLVVDLMSCCFGQPPGVQHMIHVRIPAGKALKYFGDQLAVEGVLKVNEKREDDYTIGLFELDATSVKPAGK